MQPGRTGFRGQESAGIDGHSWREIKRGRAPAHRRGKYANPDLRAPARALGVLSPPRVPAAMVLRRTRPGDPRPPTSTPISGDCAEGRAVTAAPPVFSPSTPHRRREMVREPVLDGMPAGNGSEVPA